MLRGINVSGQKMIKMEALRDMYANLGFEAISTYIQSGNVIFKSESSEIYTLEERISQGVHDTFGFDVPVMVRTQAYFEDIVTQNPFQEKGYDSAHWHVTFLSDTPDDILLDKITAGDYGNDEFILHNQALYLYCPNGYGNTKLTNTFFEKKLKVSATTRNWKTVLKLLEIANTDE